MSEKVLDSMQMTFEWYKLSAFIHQKTKQISGEREKGASGFNLDWFKTSKIYFTPTTYSGITVVMLSCLSVLQWRHLITIHARKGVGRDI